MTYSKTGLIAALAMACLVPLGASAQEAAPLTTKSGTIGAPPAGKAQIVFWRPGTIIGGALGCTVREGDVEVARLGAGKYWVHVTDPGKHAYSSRGEKTDTLNMELEEGETYFVRCSIGGGIMVGGAQVSPVERAEFAKRAKKMTSWKGPGDDSKD